MKIAKTFADEIKLVITDIMMPGMSGWDLVQQMRRNAYDFKYLLVSGYAEERAMRHGAMDVALPLLHKPYSFAKLSSMIAELISSGKSEEFAAKV